MATHNIHIVNSDLVTGQLTFDPSDSSHTRVRPGDTIKWHIRDRSGVDEITSIAAKIQGDRIWDQEPRRQGNHWQGVIKSTARDSEYYVYLISWRRGKETGTHDPLISIRPSHFHRFIEIILETVPGIVLGATAAFLYWRKKRMELIRENEILRKESERLKLNR